MIYYDQREDIEMRDSKRVHIMEQIKIDKMMKENEAKKKKKKIWKSLFDNMQIDINHFENISEDVSDQIDPLEMSLT